MRYAFTHSVRRVAVIVALAVGFLAPLWGPSWLDAQSALAGPLIVAQVGPTDRTTANPSSHSSAPGAAPASTSNATALAAATARARSRLAETTRKRDKARADKAALARQYQTQLAEIDKLKKQRRSWRRDRLIRDRMGRSHTTAKKLAAWDRALRQHEGRVRAAKRAVVAAVDRELAASPGATRRASLTRWRADARRGLRRDAKKIVLPDDRIDPLADPEELDYQAALLRQSEEQLARELAKLDVQAQRYNRMASLQKTRRRAVELGRFDDDRPRRSAGQPTGTNLEGIPEATDGAADPDPAPPPDTPTDAPPAEDPGGDGGIGSDDPMFDVVLADVVDASTVDALRAAGHSSNPAVKAKAAERARKQVRERLERLRKQRRAMKKRAGSLRR